jgi:hypothetical protein
MADFPNIGFTNISLQSNLPTLITKSISGREERAQVASQYWSFSAGFSNLSEAERRQLLGFIMSKRGSYSSFTIDLPSSYNDSTGSYTGTVTTTIAAAGALSFTGTVASNNTLIFKAGDLIKFAGHDKVYMITADVTSSGAGAITAPVFPAIKTTGNVVIVTHIDVPMTVRFANDALGFASDISEYASFAIDFVEVI